MAKKNKLPYISRGSYTALQNALDTGIYKDLDRIVLHTVTKGDSHIGDLCLVFPEDKSINVVGNSDLSSKVTSLTEEIENLGPVEVNDESVTIAQYVTNKIENNSQINWEEF